MIACNNDAVWNETGATMQFTVLPAWYQTVWFEAACACAFALAVWAGYRLRLRQVTAAMTTRFNERLVERTRIARELHDTLLQTIQASKLVSDGALERSDDTVRMNRAMAQVSDWLGRAVLEGRAALNSLRISTTQRNDLAEAFERATQEGIVPGTMKVEFHVVGESREVHPIVRDEFYRIGYEAIRNAFLHSHASKLEVELRYGGDLFLRVSDNGNGIDPKIVETGRAGHFGLTGMRERANRIASRFELVTSPGSGTTITLHVPGHVAFRTLGRRGAAASLRSCGK
ncbi:MAG: ATP-binding protein [Ignavibacteriota bacterium]